MQEQTQIAGTPEISEQESRLFDEILSHEATDAFKKYYEIMELKEQKREEAEAITAILADFTRECVAEKERHYMYDAALLSSMGLTNESIRTYMSEYFNADGDDKDWIRRENIACVIGDLRALTGLTDHLRDKRTSNFQDALFGSSDSEKNSWQKKFGVYDIDDIEDITSQVCREAFLLRAAQLLYRVNNYEGRDDEELLRDVADIEAFYGPVCEVIGYDGLALALNNKVKQIRLEKVGEADLMDVVDDYYSEVFGVDEKTRREVYCMALNALFTGGVAEYDGKEGTQITPSVTNYSQQHEAVYGTLVGMMDGINVEGMFRIKSQGSFGEKILEDAKEVREAKLNHDVTSLQYQVEEPETPEIMPMDVLGVTLVVEDEDQAAEMLRRLVNHVSSNIGEGGCFKYRRSPSRAHAVQIRGDAEYVKKVSQHGGFNPGNTELKINGPKDDKYQVSKITIEISVDGIHLPVRTEVQILTKQARRNARLGEIAHIIYKHAKHKDLTDEEKREASQFLESINAWGREKRKDMGEGRVFSLKTIRRGKKIREICSAA